MKLTVHRCKTKESLEDIIAKKYGMIFQNVPPLIKHLWESNREEAERVLQQMKSKRAIMYIER